MYNSDQLVPLSYTGPIRLRNPLVGKIPIDINKVLLLKRNAVPAFSRLSVHEISVLSPGVLSLILCLKCGQYIVSVLK